VNNAGVDASGKPVAEMPTEVCGRAIRTNVYGYFSAVVGSPRYGWLRAAQAKLSTSRRCTQTTPIPAVLTAISPRAPSGC
jgi:NAD(P)-dependent dehydrogenase (short-subunit alcohol dehydrogenase family)